MPLPRLPDSAALLALALLAAPAAAQAPADTARLRGDIDYLASDALDGRGTGTRGGSEAAEFIARRFEELGLAPPFGQAECGRRPECASGYRQRFDAARYLPAAPEAPGRLRTQNVAALVPGSDPALRGQVVVLGAHFDHVGRDHTRSRDLARGSAIRNGADDNASGVAALLELARRLAASPPRRSVLLVAFGAEELGLVGSRHFVQRPPLPLDSVVAMLNFDMVGRLRDGRLTVRGVDTGPGLRALVDSAGAAAGLRLQAEGRPGERSDQASFARRGIPVLHFFTGYHADYHTTTDDAHRINVAGIARVLEVAERTARVLADREGRLRPPRGSR